MSKMPAKKKSCFQITSVTTAQVATSITEDTESLDDPDESRTEDVSSEIFDVSRTTDYGPEEVCERSSSEETLNNVGDAETPGAVSPNLPVDGQLAAAAGPARSAPTPGPAAPAASPLGPGSTAPAPPPAACSSRFRVIKLDHGSGEPYRRGRWTCMEYYERDSDSSVLTRSGDCIRHSSTVEPAAERDSGLGATGGSVVVLVAAVQGAHGPDSGTDSGSGAPPPATEKTSQAGPAFSVGPPPLLATPQPNQGPGVTPAAPHFAYPAHVLAAGPAPGPVEYLQPHVAGPPSAAGPPSVMTAEGPAPAPSPLHMGGGGSPAPAPPAGPHVVLPGVANVPAAAPSVPSVPTTSVTMPNAPAPLGPAAVGRSAGGVQHGGPQGAPGAPASLPPASAPASLTPAPAPLPPQPDLSQLQTQHQPAAAQADDTRRKSEPLPQPPLSLVADNKPVVKPPVADALANPLQLTPMNSLATSVFSIAIPVDGDEDSASGGGVVAIDNKIEQAMDLVKSHLMYAVREEVEVLKEQIKELVERNSLLERENALLKSLSNNDQLSQLPSQQANPGSTSQPQAVVAPPPQPAQPPQQPNVSSA